MTGTKSVQSLFINNGDANMELQGRRNVAVTRTMEPNALGVEEWGMEMGKKNNGLTQSQG